MRRATTTLLRFTDLLRRLRNRQPFFWSGSECWPSRGCGAERSGLATPMYSGLLKTAARIAVAGTLCLSASSVFTLGNAIGPGMVPPPVKYAGPAHPEVAAIGSRGSMITPMPVFQSALPPASMAPFHPAAPLVPIAVRAAGKPQNSYMKVCVNRENAAGEIETKCREGS